MGAASAEKAVRCERRRAVVGWKEVRGNDESALITAAGTAANAPSTPKPVHCALQPMASVRRACLIVPSVLVGSDGKMRLNCNVFMDPAQFAAYAASESFVLVRARSLSSSSSSSTISAPPPMVARAIPLPSLASLCALRGLPVKDAVALDEESLTGAWLRVTEVRRAGSSADSLTICCVVNALFLFPNV